jgi:hypothetical protein
MTCSFLFDAGLPDPPMDVRVDSGPQDGTVLVTWIPVTLNITSAKEGRPITFRVKSFISQMPVPKPNATNSSQFLSSQNEPFFIWKIKNMRDIAEEENRR